MKPESVEMLWQWLWKCSRKDTVLAPPAPRDHEVWSKGRKELCLRGAGKPLQQEVKRVF